MNARHSTQEQQERTAAGLTHGSVGAHEPPAEPGAGGVRTPLPRRETTSNESPHVADSTSVSSASAQTPRSAAIEVAA